MIDAHVALPQPFTYEALKAYIDVAVSKGLDGIVILEPTYKFRELKSMYREVCATYPYQKTWFQKVNTASLKEYQDFITEMRKKEFPIDVKFELEACYFTQHESYIAGIKEAFDYDVFIGRIHFLDNIAFDWPKHSREMMWDKYNAGYLYRRYYEMMNAMLTSHLFDGIAGFDNIKLMNVKCPFKMDHTYHKMATLLAKNHIYVEDDASIDYRFHHVDKGLSKAFLAMCEQQGVEVKRVSHARSAEEVGKFE